MMTRLHRDEVAVDEALVRRLLARQLPHWSHLPIRLVTSSGTDNALFRLGSELVVRLPKIEWAVPALEKERRWLPRLAPNLPLAVPDPVAEGRPGEGYPWPWSVYRWLDGEDAFTAPVVDMQRAARDLAQFISSLRRMQIDDAPFAADGGRGAPLATVDRQTRRAIHQASCLLDADAVTAAWETGLTAERHQRPPQWFHGDIASGNLLVREGRIVAVIDFGALAVGDPACDLIVAWELFDPPSRALFRTELDVDDAAWARGRAWALCTALWALPYYLHTNPAMVAQARRKIAAVLGDHPRGGEGPDSQQ